MNDSTLPPGSRRRKVTPSSSVSPASIANPGTSRPSRRPLGLADWHRETAARRSRGPQQLIIKPYTWPEIRSHAADGWVVLHNKVYNITPYLAYHPGGATILQRVLGKDITELYHKYHSWVNADGLIGTLQVGTLDTRRATDSSDEGDDGDDERDQQLPTSTTNTKKDNDGFAVPSPPARGQRRDEV